LEENLKEDLKNSKNSLPDIPVVNFPEHVKISFNEMVKFIASAISVYYAKNQRKGIKTLQVGYKDLESSGKYARIISIRYSEKEEDPFTPLALLEFKEGNSYIQVLKTCPGYLKLYLKKRISENLSSKNIEKNSPDFFKSLKSKIKVSLGEKKN